MLFFRTALASAKIISAIILSYKIEQLRKNSSAKFFSQIICFLRVCRIQISYFHVKYLWQDMNSENVKDVSSIVKTWRMSLHESFLLYILVTIYLLRYLMSRNKCSFLQCMKQQEYQTVCIVTTLFFFVTNLLWCRTTPEPMMSNNARTLLLWSIWAFMFYDTNRHESLRIYYKFIHCQKKMENK